MAEAPQSNGDWIWKIGAIVAVYVVGYTNGRDDVPQPLFTANSVPVYAASAVEAQVEEAAPQPSAVLPQVDSELPDSLGEVLDESSDIEAAARLPVYPQAPAATQRVVPDDPDDFFVPEDEITSLADAEASQGTPSTYRVPPTEYSALPLPMPVVRPLVPAQRPTYVRPYTPPTSTCIGVGCAGTISPTTGRVRDVYVKPYVRKDGTFVSGHYRSRPRN